ncbi:hypothetical protein PVT67_15480 [Gallaecimonas kandeliae]|uniref:hypothetical protein n=1 Tax=Gallaecimonas kandeliae TaxID=3029055 RepID=UPI002647006A|nr:hypothetical protein [Gallaecimonas kandeliae]WKE65044.1 hypothetical protein PVT67_15480 [Gallaecimonas kandeliae]
MDMKTNTLQLDPSISAKDLIQQVLSAMGKGCADNVDLSLSVRGMEMVMRLSLIQLCDFLDADAINGAVAQLPAGTRFAAMPEQDLQQEIAAAQLQVDTETLFPDDTFEDGVIATIRWFLGLQGAPVSDA